MKKDLDLSIEIKKALAEDMEVSAMDIQVDTEDGVVHLDGVVDVLGEREYAEEVVRGIDGVQDVVNRLVIGMERRIKDNDLERAVEKSLIEKDEKFYKIGVAGRKGMVQLFGEVDNLAEEKEALMATMEVMGVKEVVSRLTLKRDRNGSPIDDVTVHNNVVDMFSEDSDINRSLIEVSVKKGTVILKGTVESVEDKELAGKLASMAYGVRNVNNKLHSHQGGTGGDEMVAATIRHELGKDNRVSPAQVKVHVEEGDVYLTGEVDSPEAKDAAFEVVNRVAPLLDRVKDVHMGVQIAGAKGSMQKGGDKGEEMY